MRPTRNKWSRWGVAREPARRWWKKSLGLVLLSRKLPRHDRRDE